MKPRIDYTNVPEALRGMYQLEHYIHNSGLEESLVHLVKMRASQINGRAYCLDVHSKDARALGETEQRLYLLDAWEEAPFYSERERAALALTDAVTRITEGHVPDAVFERVRAYFNEQEMIALVFTLTPSTPGTALLSRCVLRCWATINPLRIRPHEARRERNEYVI
jgi:AhpD family alkylhydroperoxidase